MVSVFVAGVRVCCGRCVCGRGVCVCLWSVRVCVFGRCVCVLVVGNASMIDLLVYVITVDKIHESRTLSSRRSG